MKKKAAKKTDVRLIVLQQATKQPDWIAEHRFHSTRLWRFDYALPHMMIAIEIEGGVWSSGRHNRGLGFVADLSKYNAAVSLGWRLFRFTPQQFDKAHWFEFVMPIIRGER